MLPQLFHSAAQYINTVLCSGNCSRERGICNFKSVSVVSGEWPKSLLSSQSFGAEPGLTLMNFWSTASFSNLYGPMAVVKKKKKKTLLPARWNRTELWECSPPHLLTTGASFTDVREALRRNAAQLYATRNITVGESSGLSVLLIYNPVLRQCFVGQWEVHKGLV